MGKWEGIDEFVAVATANSFAGGAAALGMSTTHMSRTIRKLEARVQAQLIHRTTRTVRLTDTGRIFLERCQQIILERDEAIAFINERGEPQGELRMACLAAMGEHFVAPIVQDFVLENPNLSVTLDLTNRIVDLVAEGYDLAIRVGQLQDSSLIGTRIASRTLYTCASPAYLDRNGRPEQISDLRDHECLIGTSSIWLFRRGDSAEEIYRPHGRLRCNSGGSIALAAEKGMGICQLPDFYVQPLIARGTLEAILTDYTIADEPIWAVYPQRRHLLPKVSVLVEKLRAKLPVAMNKG